MINLIVSFLFMFNAYEKKSGINSGTQGHCFSPPSDEYSWRVEHLKTTELDKSLYYKLKEYEKRRKIIK